jgi:S-adenosylmethionine hydrolase
LKPAIITLLTDFGARDYFVGAMKGVILSLNPDATIVDLTHEIPPQDIQAAAFNLLACFKDFPAGTIHVAVVDPGVGSDRRAIVVECSDQFFIGPDNGLFSWIVEREGAFKARELTNNRFFRNPVSATFHGRDVFAPVAGALSTGISVTELGDTLPDINRLPSIEPKRVNDGTIQGRVIHIDHFGNCVTNLSAEYFARATMLFINQHKLTSFFKFFAEARRDDDPFCFVGSAGLLEIATRDGRAASILSVECGQSVTLKLSQTQ